MLGLLYLKLHSEALFEGKSKMGHLREEPVLRSHEWVQKEKKESPSPSGIWTHDHKVMMRAPYLQLLEDLWDNTSSASTKDKKLMFSAAGLKCIGIMTTIPIVYGLEEVLPWKVTSFVGLFPYPETVIPIVMGVFLTG